MQDGIGRLGKKSSFVYDYLVWYCVYTKLPGGLNSRSLFFLDTL